jgi:hypothetical protein
MLFFGFSLIIVRISLFLCLYFPDSFENPGNPNKKSVFVLFGFSRFHIWISRIFVSISPFFVWISSVLNFSGKQFKQKLFFVWISGIFFVWIFRIFVWISLRSVFLSQKTWFQFKISLQFQVSDP